MQYLWGLCMIYTALVWFIGHYFPQAACFRSTSDQNKDLCAVTRPFLCLPHTAARQVKEITSKVANKKMSQFKFDRSCKSCHHTCVDVAVTAGDGGACQTPLSPEIHLRFKQQEWKTWRVGAAFCLFYYPHRHADTDRALSLIVRMN